jgi:hypothetical protein
MEPSIALVKPLKSEADGIPKGSGSKVGRGIGGAIAIACKGDRDRHI